MLLLLGRFTFRRAVEPVAACFISDWSAGADTVHTVCTGVHPGMVGDRDGHAPIMDD